MGNLTRRDFSATLLALSGGARRLAAAPTVDDVLRDGIARRKIPAAVGMFASADKILYSGAFGTRDPSGVPVTIDSIEESLELESG